MGLFQSSLSLLSHPNSLLAAFHTTGLCKYFIKSCSSYSKASLFSVGAIKERGARQGSCLIKQCNYSGIYECWFLPKGSWDKATKWVMMCVGPVSSMTDTGLDRWITKCCHQKQPNTSCLQPRIIPASTGILSHLKGHSCDERQCLQHCAGKPLKSGTNKYRYDCTFNKRKSSTGGSGKLLHTAVLMLARERWGQQDKGFGALYLHTGK